MSSPGYPGAERLAPGEAPAWRGSDDVRARLQAATQGAALRDLAPGPPPVSNEAVLERLLRAAGTSTSAASRPGTSAASPARASPAVDARGRGSRRSDAMAPLLRAAQDSLRRAAAAAEADVAGQGRELAQDLSYDGRAWRELFEQRVLNSARQNQGGQGKAPPARSAPTSPRRLRQRDSGGGNPDVVSGALATLRQLADRSPAPAPRRKEESRRGRAEDKKRDQQQRGQPRRDGQARGGRSKESGGNTRRASSSSVPPPTSRNGPLGAMSNALDSFRTAAGNTLRDLTPGRRRPAADAGRAARDDVAPAAPAAPVLGGFVSLSFTPGTREPMHVLLGGGAMGGVGAHAAAPVPGPWQPGWTPQSRSGVSTPSSSYAGGLTPSGGSTPPDTPRSAASVTSVASSGLRAWAQGAGQALATGLGATLLRAAAGGVSASISRVTSRAGSAASTPGGGATPQMASPQRSAAAERAARDSMASSLAAMPRLRLSGTTDDESSAAASRRPSGSDAAAAAATRNSRREQLQASLQQPQQLSREQSAALAAAASARARAEAAAAAESERLSKHAAELARRLEEVERSGEAAAQAAVRKAVASGAWHADDDDPDDVALSQRLATVGTGPDLSPEEQVRLQAVITIQAAFWAWQARKLDSARRVSAATVIQAWWRGYTARGAYETMREPVVAATIIQCCWRGYISRKAVSASLSARTVGATRIQAAVRGHLARKTLFHRLQVEDAAAVAIQAVWRGYATRRVEAVRRVRVISAVVCIQAAWMAFKARHLRDARDYISACIIQTAWRGFAARRAYVITRWISAEAAVTIQAHWRRYLARREAALVSARRTAAALRIQAAWLGYLERRLDVQRNDVAAVTIQRIWRGASTRATVTAETDRIVAATLIAAAWRGATARRTAAELRARAKGRAIGTSDYAPRLRQHPGGAAASPGPRSPATTARRAQAAVVIQSNWRGTMGREQATYVRNARDAANVAHGDPVSPRSARSAVDVKQAALEEVRARAAASAARAAALRLDIPPAGSPAAPTSPTSPRGRPPLPPAGNGVAPGSAVRRSFTVAEAQRSFGSAVARSAHQGVAASPGAYVAPSQQGADTRSGSALAALSRIRAAAEATASAHAAQRTAAAANRVRAKK